VNQHLRNLADALYWSFITATTVGYGDIRPVTPEGKVIAGVLVLLGIRLIGATSSRLTALWLHKRPEQAPTRQGLHELRDKVAMVRALLEREERAKNALYGLARSYVAS
jgi:voltage-gated potassium channel